MPGSMTLTASVVIESANESRDGAESRKKSQLQRRGWFPLAGGEGRRAVSAIAANEATLIRSEHNRYASHPGARAPANETDGGKKPDAD
jgi:hypothetical protein